MFSLNNATRVTIVSEFCKTVATRKGKRFDVSVSDSLSGTHKLRETQESVWRRCYEASQLNEEINVEYPDGTFSELMYVFNPGHNMPRFAVSAEMGKQYAGYTNSRYIVKVAHGNELLRIEF